MRRHNATHLVLAGLLLAAGAAVQPAAAGEVVIHASELKSAVLSAAIGERVTFVNHSGRAAHVEFGLDPDRHHVFRVADEIWAIFHWPGRMRMRCT